MIAPRIRPALVRLADLIVSRPAALRRDECGDWRIRGRCGHIYAVSPERFQLVFTGADESARRWNSAKERLRFARLAQDGEFDGSLFLDRLPTADEGKTMREVLGIPKRRQMTEGQRLALISAGAGTRIRAQKLPSDEVPATTLPEIL